MKILFIVVTFVCSLYAKDKVIAFAQDTMANDWRVAQVKQMQDALSGVEGVKFIYKDANGDTALQISHIEEFITQKVDVIITSPKDSKLSVFVAKKVKEAGIPLILISRGIESDDYTTFIRPENYDIGVSAAEFIAKSLNGKGKVFVLQHIPTTTPAIGRTNGFFDTIKKYPSIKVVDMKVAESLRQKAILATEDALRNGLKFDAIYAQSDSMAIGAIMALELNKIDPKNIVITGIDYISDARKLIQEGKMKATYIYPTGGKEGAQIALDILAGKKVPKDVILKSEEITKENVDKIKPIF
ncbi:MAG: substrate-binding domain-containing protein [Arcobacteraceae bacterium]